MVKGNGGSLTQINSDSSTASPSDYSCDVDSFKNIEL